MCSQHYIQHEVAIVVDPGTPVAVARVCADRERSMDVRMNEGERGRAVLEVEEGNGAALSLPGRHGSQIGSARAVESSFRPRTIPSEMSFLTPA